MFPWLSKGKIRATLKSPRRVREYLDESHRLSRELSRSVPLTEVPATLHAEIMHAVRSAAQTGTAQNHFLGLPVRLAFTAGAVVVLLLGLLSFVWLPPRPAAISASDHKVLAAADRALSLGTGLSRTAPAALVSPVSQELQFLSDDLNSAAQLVAASIP